MIAVNRDHGAFPRWSLYLFLVILLCKLPGTATSGRKGLFSSQFRGTVRHGEASMIRKQSDEQMLAQLAFLFIQPENPSPGTVPHPHGAWGFPPQLT